jgi:hypothetical protein
MRCLPPPSPSRLAAAATLAVGLAVAGAAGAASAQCRGTERPIAMKLALAPAPSTATTTKRIQRCSKHDYRLRLKAGQRVRFRLTSRSRQRGMLTIFAPSGDRPADGRDDWSGTLKETGEYKIEVGTDVTTTYTLRVVLRQGGRR